EPLSNLDAALRDEMQYEIKRLQRELKITSIFVTHDQAEALSLSDKICVLDQGVVQQFGAPEDIYHRPANGFVAGFIGRSNRLRGRGGGSASHGRRVRLPDGTILCSVDRRLNVGEEVEIILRRQAVRLAPCDKDDSPLRGAVAMRSFSGARIEHVVRLE